MPTYSFTCESCEKSFDSFLTMSKSDEPLGEPCPECGVSGKVRKAYTSAPSMAIDDNHRIDKPHNVAGFADRIAEICDNAPAIPQKEKDRLRAKHCH